MSNPEYKSQRGATTISTSSSLIGVMQNSKVFCDFDLSCKGGSIHDIQDILLEMQITNNSSVSILYLTSTYLMYDLIQIMFDDVVVEEIRSDNTFVDHSYYSSEILGCYGLLEGFGDNSVRPIPYGQFVPYISVEQNKTNTYYIVLPPTLITNKNIPMQFVNSNIKLRIYFKTAKLVLSNYSGNIVPYNPINYSTDFNVSGLNCILIGNKYDENTLGMMSDKYVGKRNIINTNTHAWRSINIGRPDTNLQEVKVSLNGKMNDLTFFIRESDTTGVKGAQYIYDVSIPATPKLIVPSSNFLIEKLTLKDSQGDYSGYYSDIKGQVLALVKNKYEPICSLWSSIFPMYTFNFSDNLQESIKTGNNYGYCNLDGNFNLIFNTFSDISSSTEVNSNIDLIITGHQQKIIVLDENGKLYMPKNQ